MYLLPTLDKASLIRAFFVGSGVVNIGLIVFFLMMAASVVLPMQIKRVLGGMF